MSALARHRRRRGHVPAAAAAGAAERPSRITVLLVEDRGAVSHGLRALLNWQPDLRVEAAAADTAQAIDLAARRRPDVCLLSALVPRALSLTDRLALAGEGPRVLIAAEAIDDRLAGAAILAGADGIVARGAEPARLAAAIRHVAAGVPHFPALDRTAPQRLADLVVDGDRPIAAMALLGVHADEIAARLGISARALRGRRRAILEQLDARLTGPPRG